MNLIKDYKYTLSLKFVPAQVRGNNHSTKTRELSHPDYYLLACSITINLYQLKYVAITIHELSHPDYYLLACSITINLYQLKYVAITIHELSHLDYYLLACSITINLYQLKYVAITIRLKLVNYRTLIITCSLVQ
jgi:hypothetical protein